LKAKLHIQTILREGNTKLGNCYFSPPFKVMNITEDRRGKDLHLMLMSSSPGILDEDDYELIVDVVENGSLQLHTQSYQRLFNMQVGATQKLIVNMQEGSSFCYLPHPSVPHENSIFIAKNNIHLSTGCKLVWGEILTCGRKLNGEVFQFSKYQSVTNIYHNNKLVVKENLLMQPSILNLNLMGQMEGFTHQASMIVWDESIAVTEVLDSLYEFLSLQMDIEFGVSALQKNGIVIRLLGYKAEQLFDCLKAVSAMFQVQKLAYGC
jgi:urease accessory protein